MKRVITFGAIALAAVLVLTACGFFHSSGQGKPEQGEEQYYEEKGGKGKMEQMEAIPPAPGDEEEAFQVKEEPYPDQEQEPFQKQSQKQFQKF